MSDYNYNPMDWYWQVGEDRGKFWSSKLGGWTQETPEVLTKIGSLEELAEVLAPYGLVTPFTDTRDVKKEAERRILLVMTDYQQRNELNFLQESMINFGIDVTSWPADLKQFYFEYKRKWDEIKRLRARCANIEAMTPVPENFRDDVHWM